MRASQEIEVSRLISDHRAAVGFGNSEEDAGPPALSAANFYEHTFAKEMRTQANIAPQNQPRIRSTKALDETAELPCGEHTRSKRSNRHAFRIARSLISILSSTATGGILAVSEHPRGCFANPRFLTHAIRKFPLVKFKCVASVAK
jgi:hypothetical protein